MSNALMTNSLYVNVERKVARLDFNHDYPTSVISLLSSPDVCELVAAFLKEDKRLAMAGSLESLPAKEYLAVFAKVMIDDPTAYDQFSKEEILASLERFYSFYRSLLRVSVIKADNNHILGQEFKQIDRRFNELVLQCYRMLEEKLQGFGNRTFREVSAGTNASLLVRHHVWASPERYQALNQFDFIDKVMLRPPLLMHTISNKRKGLFTAVDYNPIDHFNGKAGEWYCYPAKIGETLAFIYFQLDYLVNGLALANLFELAPKEDVIGHKPDVILLFGVPETEGMVSHYHHDDENGIWVGEVPYTDDTTYFGYMKKMCLTLHNLHQINHGLLPIHGSMVKIRFKNGKQKTVVFFGDSGAGKSESIEALQEVADDQIIAVDTIFDDMGSFKVTDDGKVVAQGTETGAFVRLDDLSSSVAFNNMDRGVFLNPERKNARVIIPAAPFAEVVAQHDIDMWLYANNYDDGVGVHYFEAEAAAKEVFIAGKRKALGTTDEVGMTTTFFANPFGPVQEEAKTRPVIDKVFAALFKQGVPVGEIYTHLGNDKSPEALHASARALLKDLMEQ